MKIPDEYDYPEVQAAVEEWQAHYKQAFKRKWSQLSATKAFNRLAREGLSPTEIVESIDHSIEMGYRGIFRAPAFGKKPAPDVPWVVDTRKGYKEKWVIQEEEN